MENNNDEIRLVEAIRRVKEKEPWVPEASLRNAVRDGTIPSKRSSLGLKAHYIVRMKDVENWVDALAGK